MFYTGDYYLRKIGGFLFASYKNLKPYRKHQCFYLFQAYFSFISNFSFYICEILKIIEKNR